jgi:hypothetical protein
MRDSHDEDDELIVLNGVEDAIVAFPYTIQRRRRVGEFHYTIWSGFVRKRVDAAADAPPYLVIEFSELSLSRRSDFD